jgi:hypothetical protein
MLDWVDEKQGQLSAGLVCIYRNLGGSLHLWPLFRHIAQTKEEIADIVARVWNNT